MESVKADFDFKLSIPEMFEATVPAYDPKLSKQQNEMPPPQVEINPQTKLICSMLDLTDPNAVFLGKDSTFKLPNDAVNENVDGADEGDNDGDDDADDDYDSEQSFMSLSGSEKSFSDRSFSLLSTGNDSILSAGSESFTSHGNPDEISIPEDDNNVNQNQIKLSIHGREQSLERTEEVTVRIIKLEKQLSLSEKLKKCPPSESGSSSDTAPSANTSQDENNDDTEFADILAAQKAEGLKLGRSLFSPGKSPSAEKLKFGQELFSPGKSESAEGLKSEQNLFSPGKSDSDSEIVDSRNSSAGLDCKSLEISGDDAELQEMLLAQSSGKKTDSVIMEISAENDDVEFLEIVAAQKQKKTVDNLPECSVSVGLDKPMNQSSPIVNIESKCLDYMPEKFGQKRIDTPKCTKSPASKKFKRRNQDMYVPDESVEEV